VSVARYGEAGAEVSGRPTRTVMTMTFQLYGQEFMALNGGPHFTFTPAISFLVNCETQEEVDELWEKLSDGGEIEECGWLKDKYGVSWQIVPALLGEMLQDEGAEKSERVMKALLQMDKIDIETIKQAHERRSSSTASKERGQWTDRNRCFRIFTTSFGTCQHSLQGASYVHSRIFDIPGRRSGDAGKN
jgi:predicted 3-demethylubiquinone-9 3-methyltransferase (glyoxalase superfamily)